MDRFRIRGGKPLRGKVVISGSKNAALPAMAASLLTADPVLLHGVPEVRDVATLRLLVEHLGGSTEASGTGTLRMQVGALSEPDAPYDLVRKMRASVLVLGPLLARRGRAHVSLPGGCAIGERPVDLHISALRRLGATVEVV
ncbi:MAG TPA: UDP-N-acetylglucosamine 1-carboxyvinyltransferase, partial [Candidatus Saccharimonadales bacterium]|nr:UDP-N-acetylglucosamine 1-carboxyvinyltransferase [Candidatus Saccharimonadales bacterium]